MYCTNCGKELPENSKFCNYCGTRQGTIKEDNIEQTSEPKNLTTRQMREKMRKNNRSEQKKKPGCFSIAIAAFSLIFAAICFMASTEESIDNNKNGSSTIATTEAPIMISAKSLIKAYQENEINASNKYKGKYLKVTGYVDDIGQSDNLFMSDSYYIYIDDGDRYSFNDIRCSLNDESVEKAADFKPGDKIEIIGRCEGFSITSIDMYDCIIVE